MHDNRPDSYTVTKDKVTANVTNLINEDGQHYGVEIRLKGDWNDCIGFMQSHFAVDEDYIFSHGGDVWDQFNWSI